MIKQKRTECKSRKKNLSKYQQRVIIVNECEKQKYVIIGWTNVVQKSWPNVTKGLINAS